MMPEQTESNWKWVERFNSLAVLIPTLLAVLTSVATYFGGFYRGQEDKANSTETYIEALMQSVPPSQRERVAPVFDAVRKAISSNGTEQQNKEDINRTAQIVANAVTGLPTGPYSIGTSRIFEVPEERTALVCGDRYHVAYRGPTYSNSNMQTIYVDKELWNPKPGETKSFSVGLTLTLMKVENKRATFDIKCD